MTELRTRLANEGIRSSDDDLFQIIRELQGQSEIRLLIPISLDSFPRFLIDWSSSWWFYATILISFVEIFLVRYNEQDPLFGSLRLGFGLGLLGFLPGYATVRVLFPKNHLNLLEQILLSVFFSVVVSIALGVLLGAGYLFNGSSSVFLSSGYTIAMSIFAAYRRYSSLKGSRRRLIPVS